MIPIHKYFKGIMMLKGKQGRNTSKKGETN